MTDTPNFRAQCAELLAAIQLYTRLNPAADEMSSVEITEKLMDAMAATAAAIAIPPPEPPTIGNVEEAARAIYSEAMTWAAKNSLAGITPPWVEGGNSTAQDVARQVARSLATPPPEPPTDEELIALAVTVFNDHCATAKDYARAVLERWGR